MKLFKLIWNALIAMLLIFSCSNEQLEEKTISELNSSKRAQQKTVTVPFKADFFTLRDYSFTPDCSTNGDFNAPNHQVGSGDGTHLGEFTATISFCSNLNTFQYAYGSGMFIADNGDELYFNVPASGDIGQIFPVEDELYEFRFTDSFEFTGGTGRFLGASGGGYTDSWVDLFDDNGNYLPEHQTDHMFKGELTFYPGKRSNK